MTAFIGVLMLDTAFERVPGDAGHPGSYPLPARLRVIDQAGSTEIVRDGQPAPELIDRFIEAAKGLEAEGAVAITSTCGFLVTVQDQIAASVRVPVMLSALSLFPVIRAAQGGRRIGVLTASAPSLGPAAQSAAGIAPGEAVIVGMQDCDAFARAILVPKAQQPARIDRTAIETAAVAKAKALCAADPELGAVLLECGNLPPYAQAIRDATGKPVYSILDAVAFILTQTDRSPPKGG